MNDLISTKIPAHHRCLRCCIIPLGQCFQENLEVFRVGRRHDQIDAGSILWADCAIEVDEFANELEATCGLMPCGARYGRGRFIWPNRASSANPAMETVLHYPVG